MVPSIGHRFPLLLCCEVVSPRQTFLVRKSADWNFFLVSRSAFPAVVGQLWDAHTMDWVHLRVDGCGGNVEDKQSHSLGQLGC